LLRGPGWCKPKMLQFAAVHPRPAASPTYNLGVPGESSYWSPLRTNFAVFLSHSVNDREGAGLVIARIRTSVSIEMTRQTFTAYLLYCMRIFMLCYAACFNSSFTLF